MDFLHPLLGNPVVYPGQNGYLIPPELKWLYSMPSTQLDVAEKPLKGGDKEVFYHLTISTDSF